VGFTTGIFPEAQDSFKKNFSRINQHKSEYQFFIAYNPGHNSPEKRIITRYGKADAETEATVWYLDTKGSSSLNWQRSRTVSGKVW